MVVFVNNNNKNLLNINKMIKSATGINGIFFMILQTCDSKVIWYTCQTSQVEQVLKTLRTWVYSGPSHNDSCSHISSERTRKSNDRCRRMYSTNEIRKKSELSLFQNNLCGHSWMDCWVYEVRLNASHRPFPLRVWVSVSDRQQRTRKQCACWLQQNGVVTLSIVF